MNNSWEEHHLATFPNFAWTQDIVWKLEEQTTINSMIFYEKHFFRTISIMLARKYINFWVLIKILVFLTPKVPYIIKKLLNLWYFWSKKNWDFLSKLNKFIYFRASIISIQLGLIIWAILSNCCDTIFV